MANQSISEQQRQQDGWRPARLIPTSGIKGVDDQETRATSALLSVMMSVPEFARALLRKVNAPAGNVRTYIEVPIKTELGIGQRPDGAIIVTKGSTTWIAFVEVKTGVRELDAKQIEGYLDLAREQGFDAVISISNQMTTALDPYPLSIDRRKTRSVSLHHWSWVEVLSEAVAQKEVRGVSDADQAWILGELIAYLEHPQSGAMQFQDMGPNWVSVRDGAREGTLSASDSRVGDVVTRWDQFMQYLSLHLGRDLGLSVKQILGRNEQVSERRQYLMFQLVQSGRLDGTLRVPRASGDISIVADLRSRMVTVSVEVPAPTDRGSPARLSWLLRQLDGAPGNLRIDIGFKGGKSTGDAMSTIRENPKRILQSEKGREVRSFVVLLSKDMGTKRGGTAGSFIGETSDLLLSFYREVVQKIRPWSASPVKLPTVRDAPESATQPDNIVEQMAREQSDDIAEGEVGPVTPAN
jgi:hypothetical protein